MYLDPDPAVVDRDSRNRKAQEDKEIAQRLKSSKKVSPSPDDPFD